MEQVHFDYSLKSIPIPNKKQYLKVMVEKMENFIRRIRWKLFAIENPDISDKKKENFGFNTNKCAPAHPRLKAFEEDLFALTKNITYKPVHDQFQTKLSTDVKKMNQSDKIYVNADKTRNVYKISTDDYNRLLKNNVTQDYKTCEEVKIKKTNDDAREIAKKLEISDRVDKYIKADAFITIKDTKPGFPGRVTCRLINPGKSNIGKISKSILEKIIITIKSKTGYNQWKNSLEVTEWFENLPNKSSLNFIKFDIVSFYPSITRDLLLKAVKWAETHHSLQPNELDIIMHSRESYLFSADKTWVKKETPDFDVAMGSYDGAEVCELIGLYILSKLKEMPSFNSVGLYRDDGLGVTTGSGPQNEKLKKDLHKLFATFHLKITVDSNIRRTDFLDLLLDLQDETYKPYRKDNQPPLYINVKSNHPPCITRQLPDMIADRVSNLCSTQQIFENESKPYQEALEKAGYTEKLKFKPKTQKPTRTRKRKIIWFNPPFSKNVNTNVAKQFLNLIDKHFANTDLGKYFNRKTVKVSYCCMPNMEQIISGHNKKLLNPDIDLNQRLCNCRGGLNSCPLEGQCLKKGLIYNAKVTTDHEEKNYIGLTTNTFKERFANHKKSFNSETYENNTHLSKHIWKLKRDNKPYNIKWNIMARAKPYHPAQRRCQLCLTEKLFILTSDQQNTLNQRSELVSTCRHRDKHLLSCRTN